MAKTIRPAVFPKASKMVPQKAEVAEMPSFDAPVGEPVSETELPTAIAPIENEAAVLETVDAELPTAEEVTFTAVATDVKPLATRSANGQQRLDQVALEKNGRIIVQAVSRKQAESIVKNNPAIKIV